MTVNELIEKLQEFDGDLSVESISYAMDDDRCGRGCCSTGPEYEYDEVSDPYVAPGTIARQVKDGRSKSGYRVVFASGDVVRIDAR